MKSVFIPIFLTLLLYPAALFSQNEPIAVLEYFENPSGDMYVTDRFGDPMDQFQTGEPLLPGSSISTGEGIAEIKLHPNGTILKLSEHTEFLLCNLQDFNNSPINEFELRSGKMRVIAARNSNKSYYNVRTPTAVMSVLGTDFINEVGSQKAGIIVRLGTVEVIPFAGNTVVISANQSVDTLADVFEAKSLPLDQVNGLFNSMSFIKLDPDQVPGHVALPKENVSTTYDSANIFEQIETAVGSDNVQEPERVTTPVDSPPPEMEETKVSQSRLSSILKDILGMEFGVFNLDGNTYSKIVFQPTFRSKNFRISLHLPIIYSDDLFDPAQWYKPEGNREWSFGTDQDGAPSDVLLDVLKDTMLKINYLNIGQRDISPFYLDIGNIHDISLGHGGIMKDYANDHEYPSIRKIGLDLGFNTGILGLELLGDNLAEPSVFGSRFYLNPFKGFDSFEIGFSGVIDLFPSRVSVDARNDLGDPWLLLFGLDIEFFNIGNEIASVLLYGDLSSFLPVFRGDTTLFSAGMPGTDFWYDNNDFLNYAIIGGLKGHVKSFFWSLEYRMNKGIHKPVLFDSAYDRKKIEYLNEIINYIDDSAGYGTAMGIYGEAGINAGNKLIFEASYYLPWQILNGDFALRDDDIIRMKLILPQDLHRRIPLSGSVSYERTGFIDSLSGETQAFFDGNTVVKVEAVISMTQNLQIVLSVSTTALTDADGNILFEDDGNTPEVTPLYNLETRIRY